MANGCSIIGSIGKDGESCCDAHDREYSKGEVIAKAKADFALAACIIQSNWLMTPLAILMFVLCFTFGWIWWLKYLARRLFGWFPKKDD